jgi:TM2 domain-containing membrane protein YozV
MNSNRVNSNPGIAAVLSFVFSGLGQLYNGQIFKGLTIIFISALNMLTLTIGSIIIGFWLIGTFTSNRMLISGLVLFVIGIILICTIGIYSILDAFKTASKK